MGFYNVHCTNCGYVTSADKMAIDVDLLLKKHLAKSVKRYSSLAADAGKIFDDIKIGMYLTKDQLEKEGILKPNGAMRMDCQYVLNFIEKRYEVSFEELREEEEDFWEEDEEEDIYEQEDDPYDERQEEEFGQDDWEIPSSLIDELSHNMSFYAKGDIDEEIKRRRIKELLQFLLDHEEDEVLECSCEFKMRKDDKGNEFTSTFKVTYVDDDVDAYKYMVCPECGEPFFVEAGRYEERIIVMLGSSRVGKTAYLAALVDTINPEYGQPRYPSITIQDTLDKKYVFFKNNILIQYRHGKKIPKTDEKKETVALFSLIVRINQRKRVILTFVDLPGEAFDPRNSGDGMRQAGGKFIFKDRKICKYADAFWLCVDPRQIDRSLFNTEEDGEDKVNEDIDEILSSINDILDIMGDGKEDAPMAIIITKSDLIDRAANLYSDSTDLETECLLEGNKFVNNRFQSTVADVKSYLYSPNVKNILYKLDGMFANKSYFAVAAYGVNVGKGEKNGVSKAPSGIIFPFLWTLAALGHLQIVKSMSRIKEPGFLDRLLGTPEVIEEYYEEAKIEELFDVIKEGTE